MIRLKRHSVCILFFALTFAAVPAYTNDDASSRALLTGDKAALLRMHESGELPKAFFILYDLALSGKFEQTSEVLQQCKQFMAAKGEHAQAWNCSIRRAALAAFTGDARRWMEEIKSLREHQRAGLKIGGGLDNFDYASARDVPKFSKALPANRLEVPVEDINSNSGMGIRKYAYIKINGKSHRALIDTGSYATLSLPETLRRTVGATLLSDFGNRGRGIRSDAVSLSGGSAYATLSEITLGDATFTNMLVQVERDGSELVIGEGLLRHFQSVSFAPNKIVLETSGSRVGEEWKNCVDARNSVSPTFSSVKFIFPVRVNELETVAMLDSGGAFGVGVLGSSIKQWKPRLSKLRVESDISSGKGFVNVAPFDVNLSIGQSVAAVNGVFFTDQLPTASFDVMLGAEILKRNRVKLDYFKNEVCVEPILR